HSFPPCFSLRVPSPSDIYTLSLHDALPISLFQCMRFWFDRGVDGFRLDAINLAMHDRQLRDNPPALPSGRQWRRPSDFQQALHKDRKSTRLNSSHLVISYAVFCLKKKTIRL